MSIYEFNSQPAQRSAPGRSLIGITVCLTLVVFLAKSADAAIEPSLKTAMDTYCISCHDADTHKGNFNLEAAMSLDIDRNPAAWEKVVRRLSKRQMPPSGKKRPDEQTYASLISKCATPLDRAAEAHPNPGRTDTIRRLTRTEYQNAIRDLLAIDIDATSLLPNDESSHGFDNVTVGNLSPTLLERYVTAAEKISRLAIGTSQRAPGGDTIRIRPDITQEDRAEGLPIGTRGGTSIRYEFPRDGEYDIQVRLTRDRNEQVEGLHEPHEMDVLLDREQVQSFTVKPAKPGTGDEKIDAHLKFRMTVKAGPHDVGVTFRKDSASLIETMRQPYNAHFNMHRHPRLSPAVYQVSITGPFEDHGAGDTPSRQKVFTHRLKSGIDEETARQDLLALMHRAYRRPVGDADLDRVLPFYQDARHDGDFDAGMQAALSAILVSPEFLFRVEQDPSGMTPHTAYQISDLELASRLSFFLWSSIPDDALLAAAERGELHQPAILEKQTRRMLADPRSHSLVSSFVEQWLHLRNLEAITPDARLYPDFDDNLRQAFRQETELLFDEVMREDHSVLALLKSDHTYLNERLAKHYDIPFVYGTRFRRVDLPPGSQRGGILRHASILTVTSYATRTSPVIRGKWVLENLLGITPPPPPPNVPALEDNTVSASLPVRQRLVKHRANATCANCHALTDPVGFAFENFDAVGRWRTMEEGSPVDASGGFYDGSEFTGVSGLESALLARPTLFVDTMIEKLLTYSLGRGVETFDGPAIRKIEHAAQADDYRFSALICALVQSTPFQMRTSQ